MLVMFLFVLIDDTTEGVSLLCWPKSAEGDNVQVNGLNIKSSGKTYWDKKTTQPFPRQLMAFDFSTAILNINQVDDYECVKLASGSKTLEYGLKNGDIRYNNKKITSFKGLTVKDTIQFSVRRLVVDSETFNLCQIRVNETKCCSEIVLEGADLYPAVFIESSGVEINTKFCIGHTQGKEGMFIYFLNT